MHIGFGGAKLTQACKVMEDYKIDVLGVAESRWTDQGEFTSQTGELFLYSGGQTRLHGVGFILSRKAKQSMLEFNPVSDRIITTGLNCKFRKITLIQCYAPTEAAEGEDKDEFYEALT